MYLVVPVSSITRLVDVNFDIIRVELETIRFQISMLVINDVSTFSSTTDSHYSAGGIRVFKTAALFNILHDTVEKKLKFDSCDDYKHCTINTVISTPGQD